MAAPPTQLPRSSHPGGIQYQKIQELSSGGMGSVDLAIATGGPFDGRIVAVKRLHPHLEREKQFADMFFDEALITSGLRHANVVEMFDWGEDANGKYLAMEFVPGDSLHGLIRECAKQRVAVPLDIAVYIAARTAEGLHAAHELKDERGKLRMLVHRDVSPQNVLLGRDGAVKLIDFGVAKARDRMAHTSTGAIKGKFGYMSPEQARGGHLDRRSDVFALGVVMWETLATQRLYRSESELEILRMITEDPPVSVRTLRPDVPESVDNVLLATMAKNREDRLDSCAEFADLLRRVSKELGLKAGQPEVAAFFARVMPERLRALDQLVANAAAIARQSAPSFDAPATVVTPPPVYLSERPTAISSPSSRVRHLDAPTQHNTPSPWGQNSTGPVPAHALTPPPSPAMLTGPMPVAVAPNAPRSVPVVPIALGALAVAGILAAGAFALGRARAPVAPTASIAVPAPSATAAVNNAVGNTTTLPEAHAPAAVMPAAVAGEGNTARATSGSTHRGTQSAAHAATTHTEPSPAPVVTAHAEPAHTEPAHTEPVHTEPAHAPPPARTEPAHTEPAPHNDPPPRSDPAPAGGNRGRGLRGWE